jgi:hypothetical protein
VASTPIPVVRNRFKVRRTQVPVKKADDVTKVRETFRPRVDVIRNKDLIKKNLQVHECVVPLTATVVNILHRASMDFSYELYNNGCKCINF